MGVDSIWTGLGLPRVEMSVWDRLELSDKLTSVSNKSEKKALAKVVRRAYYRSYYIRHYFILC